MYGKLNPQLPAQLPASNEAEAIRADASARLAYNSIQAAVFVPALQATIAGAFCGPVVGLAGALLDMARPWAMCGLAGMGTAAIVYLASLQRWHAVKMMLDSYAPMDQPIPAAGAIQANNIERVSIDLRQDNRTTQIMHLSISAERLAEVARAVLAGRVFAEREFCGAGNMLSQSEFRSLRDQFAARGLLAWRNHDHREQGITWTVAGRHALERLVDLPSPSAVEVCE